MEEGYKGTSEKSVLRMYKDLWSISKSIITTTRDFWKSPNTLLSKNELLSSFNLPYIALITLATFIGYYLNFTSFNLTIALTKSAFSFSAYFFGFHLSILSTSYILKLLNSSISLKLITNLIAYAYLPIYLFAITINLLPNTQVLFLLQLFATHIIWKGLESHVSHIENKKSTTFILTLPIILFPYIIDLGLHNLNSLIR